MEDDGGKLVDDELVNEIYTLPKDTNYLYKTINLKAIPQSKGGTFTQEGFYQELFADVEVLETHKQTKTGTLNVDIAAFKPDPADITNKVVKVWESVFGKDEKEKKKKKKGDCYCDKDLTEDILKKIAPNASDKNIKKYLDGFNETFVKFNIDTCLKKIHFFAQVIHESGSFRYVVENGTAEDLAKAYEGWHGRGLMQLTTKANYEAFEKAIGEDVTSSVENRDKVSESPYAVTSAGWFWNDRKLSALSEKNDFIYITYRVNGGFNHVDDRLKLLNIGFKVLYNDCKNDSGKKTEYKFIESELYNSTKGSLAWGLWHDKNRKKKNDGCENDDALAIEGYERFIELWDSKPPKMVKIKGKLVYPKWYGLSREQAEKNLDLLK